MLAKARDRRAASYAFILSELLAILMIALASVAPLAIGLRALIIAAVTYAATSRSAAHLQAEVTRDEGLQGLWLNHLTLRIGIDSMLTQFRDGKRPVAIDWRAASKEAVADIKDARDDEKVHEDLSGGVALEAFLTVVFGIGWMALRVALGVALGMALLAVFPVLSRS